MDALPKPPPPAYDQFPPNICALHPWAPEAATASYRDPPALIIWQYGARSGPQVSMTRMRRWSS